MGKDLNRRTFLKGMAAGAVVAMGTGLPQVANGKDINSFAIFIDLTKCDGCEGREVPACVSACREENKNNFPKPVKDMPKLFPRGKTENWSKKRDVTDRLTPYNWIFVQKAELKINGKQKKVYIPRHCMHCDNPPCANLCPFGALKKMENGAVTTNFDLCMGGAKCRAVCPWHIPQRQSGVGLYLKFAPTLAGNGVMYKCNLCYDRITKGKEPACVEACPKKAMIFGPKEEMIALARRKAKEINGYLYGISENGGTNTIYLSDVPFKKLNMAIKKGPGRPHLGKVKNPLDDAGNIMKAFIIAPVAAAISGVAGAILGKKKSGKGEINNG